MIHMLITAHVGTLKDGYVRNVPLPRVPRIQSAKLIAPSRCIPEGTTPSRCIPVDAYKYADGVDAYEYASDKGTPLLGAVLIKILEKIFLQN